MTNKMVSQKNTLKRFLIFFGVIVISEVGFSSLCPNNIATTTTYFVPKMSDYCSGSKPCARFRKQVRLQGSGTMPNGKLLTYSGKKISLGGCDTAFGASGNCLIPFISVAADPRYYSMGDIIQMPALKGKRIQLPNGKSMIHPGYLIVQDTGGAIRGRNRFDFFTGSYNYNNRKNAFGIYGSDATNMSDKNECDNDKTFSVVRRGSGSYDSSLLAIEDSLRDAGNQRQVASVQKAFGAR
jgi:membrane-bound lytic murein transglycosylase A